MRIVYLEKYIPSYELAVDSNILGLYNRKVGHLKTIVLANKKIVDCCLFNEEEVLVIYSENILLEKDISDILMFLKKNDKLN